MQSWMPVDSLPVAVRPIAPTDALQLQELVTGLSARDRRWRFHGGVNGLTPARLQVMCSPGDSGLALVASVGDALVADVRCAFDVSGEGAEFGLMVAENWRRRGLASRCLDMLALAAAARGVRWLYGTVMTDNVPMLALLRRRGYSCGPCRDDAGLVAVERCIARAEGLAA